MSYEEEDQEGLERVLKHYESSKGAADKRRKTSKINVAKARAAKLAGARKKVQIEESESEDEEEESESEYEEVEIKKTKKGGGKGRAPPAADDKLARIEAALLTLTQQAGQGKKKAKKPVRRVVVEKEAPAKNPVPPQAPKYTKNLLGLYQ